MRCRVYFDTVFTFKNGREKRDNEHEWNQRPILSAWSFRVKKDLEWAVHRVTKNENKLQIEDWSSVQKRKVAWWIFKKLIPGTAIVWLPYT